MSDIVDIIGNTRVPVYRYFTADLVTGSVVMEVPFQGVTWERKISAAGEFSGSIAANTSDSETDHFDLYGSTLPGKHALYVMRDGVCVWGGIIWSRDYNITTKTLSVSASEFVSYLYHRVYWKSFTTDEYTDSTDSDTVQDFLGRLIDLVTTDLDESLMVDMVSNDYLAYLASDVHCRVNSYSVTSNVATVTTEEPHGFSENDVVNIYIYNYATDVVGTKTVVSVVNDRQFTVSTTDSDTVDGDVEISGINASYAVLKSTADLLQTTSSVNLTHDIDSDLSVYMTDATGDNNPFTFRGSEMRYVGEIIQNFASTGVPCREYPYDESANSVAVRFDYLVECSLNTDTNKFENVFKAWLVRQDVNNPVGEGVSLPDLTDLYGPTKLGANNFVFEHPGNISSLTLKETAESASTRTWVVDSGNDMDDVASKYYGSYTNLRYLEAGYPILEAASTDRNLYVSSDEEIVPYAKQYGYRLSPPIGEFSVSVNGSIPPVVGTYLPGDWCAVIPNDTFINQRLRMPYENRDNILVRKIRSMKVSVPDNPAFPETVELGLVPEWLVGE